MALWKISEDQHRSIFGQLCNVLEPRLAVYFGSASRGLWALTQALRQQLRAEHEAALALCLKMGMRSCKVLREAKEIDCRHKNLSGADLATLGKLGSVLHKLEWLILIDAPIHTGVQRLVERLGPGALPAVTHFALASMSVGDAGATALAAALGRGALPRLTFLELSNAAITDAGLVGLAPALQRLPALSTLALAHNPLGDEGLAALVAPPPLPADPLPPPAGVLAELERLDLEDTQQAGALPPPAGVLAKLKRLSLRDTQISDAGCAAFDVALDSGALPALEEHHLPTIYSPGSAAYSDIEEDEEIVRYMFSKPGEIFMPGASFRELFTAASMPACSKWPPPF